MEHTKTKAMKGLLANLCPLTVTVVFLPCMRRSDKAYQRLHASVHLPALRPRPSVIAERHRKAKTMSLQRPNFSSSGGSQHVNYR